MAVTKSLKQKLIRTTMTILAIVGLPAAGMMMYMQQRTNDANLAMTEKNISDSLNDKGATIIKNQALALKGFVEELSMTSVAEFVSRTVVDDDTIVYGMFMDEGYMPWTFADASHLDGEVDETFDWQTTLRLSKDEIKEETSFRKVDLKGQRHTVYEYAAPLVIEDEFKGTIRYGLSTQIMQETLAQARLSAHEKRIQSISLLVLIAILGGLIAAVMIFRESKKITSPLEDFTTAANRMAEGERGIRVEISSGDELEVLASSFNQMTAELKDSYENLEHKVEERTTELKSKTDDINNMLQNMQQGIFTVMEGRIVHHEFSAYLKEILETDDIAGANVMDLLFEGSTLGADALDMVGVAMDNSLKTPQINFYLNEHLFVTEYEKISQGGTKKVLEVDWNPIEIDDGTIEKMMVTLRDVTELRILQEESANQKKRLDMVGQLLALSESEFFRFIEGSLAFVAQNMALIKENSEPNPDIVGELFRNMHTIKGNARTLGLLCLNDTVHEIESEYKDMRDGVSESWEPTKLLADLDVVNAGLQEYQTVYDESLGGRGNSEAEDAVNAVFEHLVDLRERLEHGNLDATDLTKAISAQIEICKSRKLAQVLGKIIESLGLIAEQLNKPTPNFVLEPSDFMVPNDISDTVQNIFVHLVRNSLDHGIESPEERSKQGKPIEGNIVIHAKKENGNIVCELKDDGRGLNMERMKEKAIELGLTLDSITDDDLAEVIFHSGFSTAEKLTDVSGRGVGMDAVRKFAEDLGGQVTLELLSERDDKGYCPFSTVVKIPAHVPQSS